jgi:peptide/nickel transport system substrate-binding protein
MLVVAWASDIDNLLPPVSSHAGDRALYENLYTPTIDTSFDCKLKFNPAMATEWSFSEDGTVLSMTLRDDLKWSDGEALDAEDIAFSYELVADPVVASPRIGFIEHMVKGAAPKVIDSTHLEFHFTHAYDQDTMLSHASLFPSPQHVLATADRPTLKGHALGRDPLVSGPFMLADAKPGERFTFVANPNYTGENTPGLARVLFKIVPEYGTRLLQLKSGEADLMEGIQIKDIDDIRDNHPEIDVRSRGYRFMDYLAWNLTDPRFSDIRVRKALAHAANIDQMMEKLLADNAGKVYGKQAVGTITPELCDVGAADFEAISYSAEKANALLDEAGWKDTDADGIRDKDGVALRFTVVTNRENDRRIEAAQMLMAQFKLVGVEMTLNQLEFGTMTDMLKRREFEAAIGGWSAGLFVDPSALWHSDTDDKRYEFNFTGYSNPDVDALMAKGLNTPDPKVAAPIWQDVQRQVYEDQPYLFLWWREELVGVNNRFENSQINVSSTLHHLHEWSVPADQVKHNL